MLSSPWVVRMVIRKPAQGPDLTCKPKQRPHLFPGPGSSARRHLFVATPIKCHQFYLTFIHHLLILSSRTSPANIPQPAHTMHTSRVRCAGTRQAFLLLKPLAIHENDNALVKLVDILQC